MQVFSGVLVNVGSVGKWLSWIKYISIFRYGIEARLFDLLLICCVALSWGSLILICSSRQTLDINELKGMTFDCQNITTTWYVRIVFFSATTTCSSITR